MDFRIAICVHSISIVLGIRLKLVSTYISSFLDLDSDFVSIGRVDETLPVTTGGLIWDPARLLWVIRLGFELDPQLGGDH